MYLSDLARRIKEFRQLIRKRFDSHFEAGMYTPKLHFLDYLLQDTEHFGSIHIVNSSPFERYNDHDEYAYITISKRQFSGVEKTVEAMKRQSIPKSSYGHVQVSETQDVPDMKQRKL